MPIDLNGLSIVDNRCPRCCHAFRNLRALRSHLNQPYSECRRRHELRLSKCLRPALFKNATLLPRRRHTSLLGDMPNPEVSSHSNDLNDSSQEANPDSNDLNEVVDHDVVDSFQEANSPGSPSPTEPQPPPVYGQPFYREDFVGAATTRGSGASLMDRLREDQFFEKRKRNPFYPYADRSEFEIASWFSNSQLSMARQDDFFRLSRVGRMKLSFKTAKALRSRNEILPRTPEWKRKPWPTKYPTKKPVTLLYRDALDCLQSLLANPLSATSTHFTPFKLYRSAAKLVRVYTEWLSGDAAWTAQEALPPGATLLGTIITSDKTQISALTGNRVAHPLLISLANLDMDYRNKATNHSFMLLALVPIAKFLHPNQRMRGVLDARLYHDVLHHVLRPLKMAATYGATMHDAFSFRRYCFPILASDIVDTPESRLVSGVAGGTAATTMADFTKFGDPFRHEPRTASTTIAQLQAIEEQVDPWDLQKYFKAAMKFRLAGVHRPFWVDWPLADPSTFLTPEPLHHWHKMFWDHDIRWCINVVGADEIDFRFSILQPHTGYRHFKEGVSKQKQVTMREHREMQRSIVAVIAGAVPPDFLVAIRSLQDFRYKAQSPVIDETLCEEIQDALARFHQHKESILNANARRGKGNKIIDDWKIPKLESKHSVVPNIRLNGVPIQWSADTTEHAHITEVKQPARSTNNQNYEEQICLYLDRREKLRQFDLLTSLYASLGDVPSSSEGTDIAIHPVSKLTGAKRGQVDYFVKAARPEKDRLRWTFTDSHVAFHFTRDPAITRTKISVIADMYGLPDLPAALADYVARVHNGVTVHAVGGRRTRNLRIPSANVEVWSRMTIQTKSCHYPHHVLPPTTLNASCRNDEWPMGRCDGVMLNVDSAKVWPMSGLDGHAIVQVRLIFRIHLIGQSGDLLPLSDQFLAYVQRFDIIPQPNPNASGSFGRFPEPTSSLYALKRSQRANKELIGDVVPVKQIRALVDLVPRFKEKAKPTFKHSNVMAYADEFWLNKYFDREMYHILS